MVVAGLAWLRSMELVVPLGGNLGNLASMDFEQQIRLFSFQERGASQDNRLIINFLFLVIKLLYVKFKLKSNFSSINNNWNFLYLLSRHTDFNPFT